MSEQKEKSSNSLRDSFIQEQKSSLPIRILKAMDIFSFIPVPKDRPVSTKQSLIGTAIFIVIFLTYIIVDFYQFVTNNPPIVQNSFTKLSESLFILPRFAITFMDGQKLNQTSTWDDYFSFELSQQFKDKGWEKKLPVNMFVNNFQNGSIQDSISWVDQSTKNFYSILRTPSRSMSAKGLLYSTSNASYGKITIKMCDVDITPDLCQELDVIKKKCAQGRIFLFIQNIVDTTDFGSASQDDSNKFLIYNFFLIPFMYKRAIFNMQIVETVVQPDYFYRFSEQKQTRIQIQSMVEQTSDVSLNSLNETTPLHLLGIYFQLSPQVLNVRVAYSSLIDHISMWGAFWGVLFAVFAIIFLTYNRKKFYKKNPEWDNFKKNWKQQTFAQMNHEKTNRRTNQKSLLSDRKQLILQHQN